MAYMRDPYYIWSDGEKAYIWIRHSEDDITEWVKECGFGSGVGIPLGTFLAAAQHFAREGMDDPTALREALTRPRNSNG